MKFLGVFLALFSSAAMAATYEVSCGVTKQRTQGDYKVSASVTGTMTGNKEDGFTFEDYKVGYTVYTSDDEDNDEVWTSETVKGKSLDNDPKYKGTKYTKHVKFEVPSKRGNVHFIYPYSNTKSFQAHLVLTYIDDHFGGTAHVYCTRKKAN